MTCITRNDCVGCKNHTEESAESAIESLEALTDDSLVLTSLSFKILRGGIDSEQILSTVAVRMNHSIDMIRNVTSDLKNETDLMVTVARGVEEALSKICDLAPVFPQERDEKFESLHLVLEVGENLNSLYEEVGQILSAP